MKKFFQSLPKKTRILIIFLLCVILVLVLIRFLQSNQGSSSSPLPVILFSPAPDSATNPINTTGSQIAQFQKTQINKTSTEEFIAKNPLAQKQISDDPATVKYSLSSNLIARPNEVLFRSNKAEFEKIVLLTDNVNFVYPQASQLMQSFGQPEKIIQGSKFYGSNVSTYIYPNMGLAFIAEASSGNIFEIQTFTPISLDQYLRLYGQDIQEIKPDMHVL